MVSPRSANAGQQSAVISSANYLLEVDHVTKQFPGVLALDDVTLRVRPGTVHALMGENGAGKSTLMKIVAGIYQPDAGGLLLKGQPIRLSNPLDALEAGIAMIHQELNLMPFMTVAENIWIRREPLNRLGFVDHGAMNKKTDDLLQKLNIDIPPEAKVGELSTAGRQLIEIAKAVSYDSEMLIMDEPTSSIAEREVEHLFAIVAALRAAGKGIVYITHKMNEVFAIADEVSVLRDGRYVGTHLAAEIDRERLIRMMVGREITQMFPKENARIGDVVMSVVDLGLESVFSNVSFDLRSGEILGIAGLLGAGRTNVAETIFGVTPATSGQILLRGIETRIDSPRIAMQAGMAFLTEDRKETGCFLSLDVGNNMEMAVLGDRFVSHGFVRQRGISAECEIMRDQLQVKTPNLYEPMINLSGGNQQKVLIGRWLLTKPRILILDEPTRGIDVGAKAEIHRLISRLAGEGVAVIMISSELPEILGMSDRIVVMREGRVTGVIDRADADQVSIMRLAAA
jgi:inositol transport system ATP-binding protein